MQKDRELRISRRTAMKGVAAAAGAAALPGLGLAPAHAEGGKVVVGTWGGDYARLLAKNIEDPILKPKGIEVVLEASSSAITGDTRATGLALADGRVLPADLVVLAAGIRPNADLARAAGVACNRGILVDDGLATDDPAIFALGECAEHRGAVYGLVEPAYAQAKVLAGRLCGDEGVAYAGSLLATNLKVSGVNVFSAGDFSKLGSAESIRYADHAAGVYKRLWLKDNRLLAAVLFGDTRSAAHYAELIETQRDVSSQRDSLLLGEAGAA